MLQWVMISLILSVSVLAADEPCPRPQLPGAGEDTALMGGASARDFFAARAAKTDCRTRLKAAKEEWTATQALDAKERWLTLVEECGECVTRPVDKCVIPTASRTEVWYTTDGSCQVDADTASALKEGFRKSRDTLHDVPLYSRKTGGFEHLLEFLPVDMATAEWQPDVKRMESFPFYSFVALRGVELFGSLLAYTQVFEVTWEDTQFQGQPMAIVRLNGVKAPRGFTAPQVYDLLPDGKKIIAAQMRVPKVIAAWYLHEGGYVRYYTAGDFGISLKYAEKAGRRMLQETVLEFVNRWR
jgi:hypothetical protein